ncbi:uncharacterized protein LOC125203576 [Salvia hispanica]|uniref:uncharacterized protein LOC125203576 n=1 Tax=Salvia hispanica TaxID=49212 RepID=UPI0020095B1E|nr:uncharacterized protein LOC125203576 [Salvia hispanica]
MTIPNLNPGDADTDESDMLILSLSTTPANPGKEAIRPPFPWATDRRATVYSIEHLQASGIATITGSVKCKRCDKTFEVEYDLAAKFSEVAEYITMHSHEMRHRAPAVWSSPTLPDCRFCGQRNCAKPAASEKKREINWLFLFLGQMVGCCKLSELKYFCKHTKQHRTGAKDRVLYLTYLQIFNQLSPAP